VIFWSGSAPWWVEYGTQTIRERPRWCRDGGWGGSSPGPHERGARLSRLDCTDPPHPRQRGPVPGRTTPGSTIPAGTILANARELLANCSAIAARAGEMHANYVQLLPIFPDYSGFLVRCRPPWTHRKPDRVMAQLLQGARLCRAVSFWPTSCLPGSQRALVGTDPATCAIPCGQAMKWASGLGFGLGSGFRSRTDSPC
jgi:hypothetical protein